ncbi:MAG: hypothetical protein CMK32_09685 [Porticoccaceae bacterium]|nr:hypothetical protein [Porticoccaceae bacterium]
MSHELMLWGWGATAIVAFFYARAAMVSRRSEAQWKEKYREADLAYLAGAQFCEDMKQSLRKAVQNQDDAYARASECEEQLHDCLVKLEKCESKLYDTEQRLHTAEDLSDAYAKAYSKSTSVVQAICVVIEEGFKEDWPDDRHATPLALLDRVHRRLEIETIEEEGETTADDVD